MIDARGFARGLGALFGVGGGDSSHEIGGRFIDMLNHPQYGVPAANVALSVSPLIDTPAAAPSIVQGLLKRPEVVSIPGVEAALIAIETAAVATPFNQAAFDAAIAALYAALNAATPAVVTTAAAPTIGWQGWGGRLIDHLRDVQAPGPGHVGGRR